MKDNNFNKYKIKIKKVNQIYKIKMAKKTNNLQLLI